MPFEERHRHHYLVCMHTVSRPYIPVGRPYHRNRCQVADVLAATIVLQQKQEKILFEFEKIIAVEFQ